MNTRIWIPLCAAAALLAACGPRNTQSTGSDTATGTPSDSSTTPGATTTPDAAPSSDGTTTPGATSPDGTMTPGGTSPDGNLVEVMEFAGHPFFVGIQSHPEFLSRPNRPHPLFRDFVGAATKRLPVGAQRSLPLEEQDREHPTIRTGEPVLAGSND